MPTEQCVTVACCTRAAGDWMCNSCGQHNFRSRAECYKCAAPKCGPLVLCCLTVRRLRGTNISCLCAKLCDCWYAMHAAELLVRAAPAGSLTPLLLVHAWDARPCKQSSALSVHTPCMSSGATSMCAQVGSCDCDITLQSLVLFLPTALDLCLCSGLRARL